jgi:transcriptional regulator with XRE-family HTH domain
MLDVTLREARLRALLSHAELAQRTGLSPAGIVKLEAGRVARPRLKTVRLISEALGVPPESIDEFRAVLARPG